MRTFFSALVSAVICLAIQGCGNSSSMHGAPYPAAPDIRGLANQTVSQDTATGPLQFQIRDADSDVAGIVVAARSMDTNLVPAEGIVLGGSGSARTLNVLPAEDATGTTSIIVRAVDPGGLATERAFTLTVRAVTASFRSSANTAFAANEGDSPRMVSGMTFTADADDDPAAFDALLQ